MNQPRLTVGSDGTTRENVVVGLFGPCGGHLSARWPLVSQEVVTVEAYKDDLDYRMLLPVRMVDIVDVYVSSG